MFYDTAFLTLKYLYNMANVVRNYRADNHKPRLEKTNKRLLNTIFDGKFQISLRHFFELDYILKQDPEIDTIWFFGAGWEHCVKHRELGWLHMKSLTGKKLMTISTCLGPFLHKVDNDPMWEKVEWGDFIYRHK